SINSYPLLACPFFILAGNLILRSGSMIPLRDFIQAMFGHLPGGLAVAAIIFGAFLGSISGSSAACLAIFGTVMVPIFLEVGYDRPFASGLSLCAAELGLLIPPSFFLIIFGAMNRISIADLFLAGIGTGLLATVFMCLTAVIIAKIRHYPTVERATWKVRGKTFIKAFPLLLMPVLVLGGIYSGTFSPTQAASVATLYSIFLGLFVYREMTRPKMMQSIVETTKVACMIYFIIIGADLMGKMLGFVMLPQKIADLVINLSLSPVLFLIVVNLVLLAMGFFFSSLPMVIIVLPLFLPSVKSLGIDPVLYGILAIMNSLIGEITPPFGPQLWIAAPICNEKMGAIVRESWPFLGAWTLAMFLSIIIPHIPMGLVWMFR
ncbi:MAG: TRAP transporter large permease, partial [Methanosarcinaceae archaeon]|nr:TRAP transporter large permease [Methanosarcinaceae archaeon]